MAMPDFLVFFFGIIRPRAARGFAKVFYLTTLTARAHCYLDMGKIDLRATQLRFHNYITPNKRALTWLLDPQSSTPNPHPNLFQDINYKYDHNLRKKLFRKRPFPRCV